MYGTEILLENASQRPKSYSISRREMDIDSIDSLQVEGREHAWESKHGVMTFALKLRPGESSKVSLWFKLAEAVHAPRSLKYTAKAMLRRYLSEARDNYFAPAKARLAVFSRS